MRFSILRCRVFLMRPSTAEHSDFLFHRRLLTTFLTIIFLFSPTFPAIGLDTEAFTSDCHDTADGPWTWSDKSGQTQTDAALRHILTQHQTWLETAKRKGKQADLSSATLKHADLRQVNLSEANLAHSDLSYADLTHAVLNQAVLREANLKCAQLNETSLQGANFTNTDLSQSIISNTKFDEGMLTGASFKGATLLGVHFNRARMAEADLSMADLTNAEFVGADLRGASLRHARLTDTQLDGALLDGVDLLGAIYQVNTDPAPTSIARAHNIAYLTHNGDPSSLARLRGRFKETGFRDQERMITFALQSRHEEFLWEACKKDYGSCVEYWVHRILFDLTSQYGMNPGRVVLIILCIFSLSTLFYWGLIHFSPHSGLAIVVPARHDNQPRWLIPNLSTKPDEIYEGGALTKRGFNLQPRSLPRRKGMSFVRDFLRREVALFWASFVFSLMSTFNIKFRDVDFGRWLRQLTTKEYDINAVGSARIVAGLQALLSVYLVALLLITYFGRPFE